jgi:hypothetical protein
MKVKNLKTGLHITFSDVSGCYYEEVRTSAHAPYEPEVHWVWDSSWDSTVELERAKYLNNPDYEVVE